ncbi:hypothetical protein HP550_12090 [Cellulomonas humilata]|uniref:Uncharacterized protein n=1 Tax=Cellulomonas humilata TaxID=144055 RepID=A0A7Y6A1M9_9CELL|nr:hypothetical protein [Cellulomonas humilata]NUU17990.1 hypothetical protein [Cellulomonas humilata]
MSSRDERAGGRAAMPVARAARRAVRNAVGVLSVVLAMVLVGSGTAWAWWTDARSVASAATAIDIRPGTPTCTPKPDESSDIADSPATIAWAPPALPAGATATYTVTAVSDTNVTRTFTPSPASTPSLLLYPANVGSSTADRLRLQTLTVTATVTFPGGAVWTSPPSGSVKAQAVRSFFFFLNMGCPA